MKYSEREKIVNKAKKHIDQKEYQKAIDILTPIIEDDKLNNPYPFMVQLLAEAKGDYQEVLKKCDVFIEENEETYFFHTVKGNVYANLKEYDKALLCCAKAIELNPDYKIVYNLKGIVYYYLKEYDKALECYDKAIELDSEYVSAYHNKGYLYDDLKEYEKALGWYDKALKLDNEYVHAYNGKGNVYRYLKEYDKALECYDKVIELDKTYVNAYYNKGLIYDDLKEYDKALEWYEKALKLDNEYVDAYYNKGFTYYDLKKYDKAIEYYNKAIALHPDYKEDLKYWIETAQTELEEQKKNQENQERQEISNVINEIKNLLEYKEPQVCHYTSIEVFKALCNNSKLRFSHSNLVNDPTEGKTLYDFLGVESIDRKGLSGFIGSFVESHNNDSLPLWRAYGRDGRGVSICLDRKALTEKTSDEGILEESKSTNIEKTKITRKLYKIAYAKHIKNNETEDWIFFLDGKKDDSLKDKIVKLKSLLEPLIKDKNVKNEEALEPIVEIQYLFKNEIYQGEREVRYYELLSDDYSLIEWDENLSPPTTYIEVENDILTSIRNVTVGPKAENGSSWIAWYKTKLARHGNNDITVTQSKIPYR